MARTESPLTTRAVELMRQGRGLREVATLLGLSTSTLVRAAKRAGLQLPRGRPRSTTDASEPPIAQPEPI